jgi:hypothetical protein
VKLTLAEFWSKYEIVYDKNARKKLKVGKKTKVQFLKNNMGFIRNMAVLKYYLNYKNDEDLAQGLLILFMPFTNEMDEIHKHDVKELLAKLNPLITEKTKSFEKYKVMTDLIANIQPEIMDTEDEVEFVETETTDLTDIEEFNKWAKSQASKDLSTFKDLTHLSDPTELRSNISSLNKQQRRLFDDFTENMISPDLNKKKTVYLFLAGNAGTGKSFLVNILIEAVKIIKIKAGDEMKKPPVIVMAPIPRPTSSEGEPLILYIRFKSLYTNRCVQDGSNEIPV